MIKKYELPTTMVHKTLLPTIGIEVEGMGKVTFGMGLEDVTKVLGRHSLEDAFHYFYDHLGIRMERDGHGGVKAFNFSIHGNVTIFKKDPSKMTSRQLIKFLKEKNKSKIKVDQEKRSYYFLDIGIVLWKKPFDEQFISIKLFNEEYFKIPPFKQQLAECHDI